MPSRVDPTRRCVSAALRAITQRGSGRDAGTQQRGRVAVSVPQRDRPRRDLPVVLNLKQKCADTEFPNTAIVELTANDRAGRRGTGSPAHPLRDNHRRLASLRLALHPT